MILKVLPDLPFSQNQLLKSATIEFRKKTGYVLDNILKKQED